MKRKIIITESQFNLLENYLNKFLLTESLLGLGRLQKWTGLSLPNIEKNIDNLPINSKFGEDLGDKPTISKSGALSYPVITKKGLRYVPTPNATEINFTKSLDDSINSGDFTSIRNTLDTIKTNKRYQNLINTGKAEEVQAYFKNLEDRIDEAEDLSKNKKGKNVSNVDKFKTKEDINKHLLTKDIGQIRVWVEKNMSIVDKFFSEKEIVELLGYKTPDFIELFDLVNTYRKEKIKEPFDNYAKSRGWIPPSSFKKNSFKLLNYIASKITVKGVAKVLGLVAALYGGISVWNKLMKKSRRTSDMSTEVMDFLSDEDSQIDGNNIHALNNGEEKGQTVKGVNLSTGEVILEPGIIIKSGGQPVQNFIWNYDEDTLTPKTIEKKSTTTTTNTNTPKTVEDFKKFISKTWVKDGKSQLDGSEKYEIKDDPTTKKKYYVVIDSSNDDYKYEQNTNFDPNDSKSEEFIYVK